MNAPFDPVGLIEWGDLSAQEAHTYLDRVRSWPVDLAPGELRLHLGASEGDMAILVAVGTEGLDTLDKIQNTHPTDAVMTGPVWGRTGVRLMVVQQGPRPISSCDLGPGLSLVAHGTVLLPPSVEGNLALRWRRGREPNVVDPSELPSWLRDAAETLRRDAARAQVAGGEWFGALARTPKGQVKNTFANVCSILRNAPEFSSLRYNEMTLTPELDGIGVTDARLGSARERIELEYQISPATDSLSQALLTVAAERAYHPVRQYLEGLIWDRRPRLDSVAERILGAENSEINNTMIRAWFISAVARAMRPGCKVDTSLVLVGAQGLYKSTFFSILGGAWFADTGIDLESKDAMLQINHAWIYELAELDQITSRAHAGRIKSFLTSQVDKYRAPYARAVSSVPRCNVIVGSTNEMQFLADPTGARRFWCVRVPRPVDRTALYAERDQLWAEALAAYRAHEAWWLSTEAETAQREASETHALHDPWEPKIVEWTASAEGAITSTRILTGALAIEIGRVSQKDSQRVGAIMRRLGWRSTPRWVGGHTHRVWER
tara:strand:- start:198 stop:1844 length:1647 start_codon:yes stop_codon:yes gene_type:complete